MADALPAMPYPFFLSFISRVQRLQTSPKPLVSTPCKFKAPVASNMYISCSTERPVRRYVSVIGIADQGLGSKRSDYV